MKKSVTVLCAALLAVAFGCASYEPVSSLRGIDVAAADQPSTNPLGYKGSRPGTTEKIARTFQQQPPVIPHAVENFDEITSEENQCLDCHGPANYVKKNAPKLGDSHFLDKAMTKYSTARYNCVQCHVPQADAPALVENRFIGNLK